MLNYLIALFISMATAFLFIGLRSWQQLNVVHRKYWWIPPTSYSMAVCEIFLIGWMAAAATWQDKLILAAFIGTGSSAGCLLSTWLHDYLRRK